LFSITIVITEPGHEGDAAAFVTVSAAHVLDVLPEVFMQPAASAPTTRTLYSFDMAHTVVCAVRVGKNAHHANAS
jgi:hypothetical protein